MRTLILIACAFVLVTAAVAVPRTSSAASSPGDFLAWAQAKSSECDSRWDRIAGTGPGPLAAAGTIRLSSVEQPRTLRSPGLARVELQSGVSTAGFLHSPKPGDSFLPLSTRDRNGPSRGAHALTSPADAHLCVPYSMKRPVNSFSVQAARHFRAFGGTIARPRLKSFGRLSKSDRAFGGVQHPASHWDRPRK